MEGKKCALIVNVASQWHFARVNYAQLVELYDRYSDCGLQIIGFPTGDFRNQEEDTNEKIKKYTRENFKVRFPLMEKCNVNGPEAHEVFKCLKSNTKELQSPYNPDKVLNVQWNFCKWVVDDKGKVQKYIRPSGKLYEAYELIEHLLEMNKPTQKKQRRLTKQPLLSEVTQTRISEEKKNKVTLQ